MKKIKIFMGLENIASLMRDYKEGFAALGHECFCVSMHESPLVEGPVDMPVPALVNAVLRKSKDFSPKAQRAAYENFMKMAWQKALEADICFFIWESFRHDASDLAQLKQMGKKIIVRLCGSEVRDPHVDMQFATHYGLQSTAYGLPTDVPTLRHKLRYLRQVERYADVIICGSAMSLRPVSWRGACLFSQAGIVRRTVLQRKIPVILHAPSRRSSKGTDVWMATFDTLRAAGLQFGLKFIENIPHEDMLREYATADIVCGSLFYGGRATWEALAAGCVHLGVTSKGHVHCKENDKHMLTALGRSHSAENLDWLHAMRDGFAPVLASPNVDVTPETVAQTLADLILDVSRRQAIADAGPVFMDTHFSPKHVCQNILDTLSAPQTEERQADLFMAPFFRHNYIPPDNDPDRLSLFNSYNKFVSRCDWYNTFVPRGERAGLIF